MAEYLSSQALYTGSAALTGTNDAHEVKAEFVHVAPYLIPWQRAHGTFLQGCVSTYTATMHTEAVPRSRATEGTSNAGPPLQSSTTNKKARYQDIRSTKTTENAINTAGLSSPSLIKASATYPGPKRKVTQEENDTGPQNQHHQIKFIGGSYPGRHNSNTMDDKSLAISYGDCRSGHATNLVNANLRRGRANGNGTPRAFIKSPNLKTHLISQERIYDPNLADLSPENCVAWMDVPEQNKEMGMPMKPWVERSSIISDIDTNAHYVAVEQKDADFDQGTSFTLSSLDNLMTSQHVRNQSQSWEQQFSNQTLGAGGQFAQMAYHSPVRDMRLQTGESLDTEVSGSSSIIQACHKLIEEQFARHPQPAQYAESLRLHLMQTSLGLEGMQSRTRPRPSTVSSSSTSAKACSHICILCTPRTNFRSRGSLKRHISQKHHRSSVYYCPTSTATECNYESTRLDKIRKHCQLQHRGFPVDLSLVEIPDQNFPISCTECEVSPYFQSWDAWWQHIERHCRLEDGSPDAPKRSLRTSSVKGSSKRRIGDQHSHPKSRKSASLVSVQQSLGSSA